MLSAYAGQEIRVANLLLCSYSDSYSDRFITVTQVYTEASKIMKHGISLTFSFTTRSQLRTLHDVDSHNDQVWMKKVKDRENIKENAVAYLRLYRSTFLEYYGPSRSMLARTVGL